MLQPSSHQGFLLVRRQHIPICTRHDADGVALPPRSGVGGCQAAEEARESPSSRPRPMVLHSSSRGMPTRASGCETSGGGRLRGECRRPQMLTGQLLAVVDGGFPMKPTFTSKTATDWRTGPSAWPWSAATRSECTRLATGAVADLNGAG